MILVDNVTESVRKLGGHFSLTIQATQSKKGCCKKAFEMIYNGFRALSVCLCICVICADLSVGKTVLHCVLTAATGLSAVGILKNHGVLFAQPAGGNLQKLRHTACASLSFEGKPSCV